MKQIENVIEASAIIAERRYNVFDKLSQNLGSDEKKRLQALIVEIPNEQFMTAKEIKDKKLYTNTGLDELKIDGSRLLSRIKNNKQ